MDFGVACIAFLLRHRSTKFNPVQKLGPRYSHYLLSVLRYPAHPCAPNKKSSAPNWEVYRARLASLPRLTDKSTAVDFIIYRARLPSLPRLISQSTAVDFLFGAQGREETSAHRRNMVRTEANFGAQQKMKWCAPPRRLAASHQPSEVDVYVYVVDLDLVRAGRLLVVFSLR